MSTTLQTLDIQKLSVEERLEIIDALWESITDRDALFELTEEEKLELDRRLEDYHKNPDAGYTWEEVKARLRERRKSKRSSEA